MASFEVLIENQPIGAYGKYLDFSITQEKPKIKIRSNHNDYYGVGSNLYTIIMLDPDAPYPSDPKYGYFLHWLVINNNETLEQFTPPDPPTDSPRHRYFLILLKQNGRLDRNKIKITKRKNFPFNRFVEEQGLRIVNYASFSTKKYKNITDSRR